MRVSDMAEGSQLRIAKRISEIVIGNIPERVPPDHNMDELIGGPFSHGRLYGVGF